MKYAQLLIRLKEIIPKPKKNRLCAELTSNLKYLLGLLLDSTATERPNLRDLYTTSRENDLTEPQNKAEDLFRINYQFQPMRTSAKFDGGTINSKVDKVNSGYPGDSS